MPMSADIGTLQLLMRERQGLGERTSQGFFPHHKLHRVAIPYFLSPLKTLFCKRNQLKFYLFLIPQNWNILVSTAAVQILHPIAS